MRKRGGGSVSPWDQIAGSRRDRKGRDVTEVELLFWDGCPVVRVTRFRGGQVIEGVVGVRTAVATGVVTQDWLDGQLRAAGSQ